MFLKRERPETDDFGKKKKSGCAGKISIFQEIIKKKVLIDKLTKICGSSCVQAREGCGEVSGNKPKNYSTKAAEISIQGLYNILPQFSKSYNMQ